MFKITVNNKPADAKSRAIGKGVTVADIVAKAINVGFESLEQYEKDFYLSSLAERLNKSVESLTDVEILESCKADKVSYFKEYCEIKIVEGFTASNGHFYRTNRDDQTNMIGQKDDLTDTPVDVVYWKTENAGYVAHSKEEWLQIYKEAFMHKKAILFKYDTIKRKISLAKTLDEVMLISWN